MAKAKEEMKKGILGSMPKDMKEKMHEKKEKMMEKKEMPKKKK